MNPPVTSPVPVLIQQRVKVYLVVGMVLAHP